MNRRTRQWWNSWRRHQRPCLLRVLSVLSVLCIPHRMMAANLDVTDSNDSPARIAVGPDHRVYVSDPVKHSIFIYQPDLTLIGQIHNTGRTLGLAVSTQGLIYAGTVDPAEIRVYLPTGDLTGSFGSGQVTMPNDMEFGPDGLLYVADSRQDHVAVFNEQGNLLRTIGTPGGADGQFRFPSAIAISAWGDPASGISHEIHVADQGNYRVQVFSTNGTFLRKIGARTYSGMSKYYSNGYFNVIQSLQVDDLLRVHVCDSYMNRIQILSGTNGTFNSAYGDASGIFGSSNGTLRLPLDIQAGLSGRVYVANADMNRVEIIHTNPTTRVILSNPELLEQTTAPTVVGVLDSDPPATSNRFVFVEGDGALNNGDFSIVGSNLVANTAFDWSTTPELSLRIKAINPASSNLMLTEALTLAVIRRDAFGSPDHDADGMPDWWELQHAGSESGLLAEEDDDLDGQNNLAEWIAQTDPTNGMHVFKIETLTPSDEGAPVLQWPSATGRNYSIDWQPRLGDSTRFHLTNLAPTPPLNVFTDHVTATNTPRFYRIQTRIGTNP